MCTVMFCRKSVVMNVSERECTFTSNYTRGTLLPFLKQKGPATHSIYCTLLTKCYMHMHTHKRDAWKNTHCLLVDVCATSDQNLFGTRQYMQECCCHVNLHLTSIAAQHDQRVLLPDSQDLNCLPETHLLALLVDLKKSLTELWNNAVWHKRRCQKTLVLLHLPTIFAD